MPTQEEYRQLVDKVSEGLRRRIDPASLRLDDSGLMAGEGDEDYIFIGWASNPITRERVQFSLPFTATITKDIGVDAMVSKLYNQLVTYFFVPKVILTR